jgi:hypothetical protein
MTSKPYRIGVTLQESHLLRAPIFHPAQRGQQHASNHCERSPRNRDDNSSQYDLHGLSPSRLSHGVEDFEVIDGDAAALLGFEAVNLFRPHPCGLEVVCGYGAAQRVQGFSVLRGKSGIAQLVQKIFRVDEVEDFHVRFRSRMLWMRLLRLVLSGQHGSLRDVLAAFRYAAFRIARIRSYSATISSIENVRMTSDSLFAFASATNRTARFSEGVTMTATRSV